MINFKTYESTGVGGNRYIPSSRKEKVGKEISQQCEISRHE